MIYRFIIRPILFLINPESVHHLIVNGLKIGFSIPGIKKLVKTYFTYNDNHLKTNFCGLSFPNPVGLAAGFDKNATIYDHISAFGFGFVEIGTVTPKAQPGNPKPRIFRLKKDKALINRMGFNNMGVDYAVEQLKTRKSNLIIGGNIGKNTATPNENAVDDYVYCFEKLYNYVDYFVINVSCPNVSNLKALQDKESLENILSTLLTLRNQKAIQKPVLLKISPDLNFDQVDDVISIVQKTGTNGLVVNNTTITRNNLLTDTDLVNQIGNGGLSGLPLQTRATELIKYISQKTNHTMPIIGVGGIMNASDAMEKLDAGATLIQVYTGFIYSGPSIVKKINKTISKAFI